MTSLRNEIEHFDRLSVSPISGDTETWDQVVFPRVIRKREIGLIMSLVSQQKPGRVLDLGCGAGWLSRALSSRGQQAVGIDISSGLVRGAVDFGPRTCDYVVGDCMKLPFGDATFDMVASVGVLHHLCLDDSLAECCRVTSGGGTLVLMEPNSMSPLAALGRRLVSRETHTEGEVTFHPGELTRSLERSGWTLLQMKYMFPYSFAIAYALGRSRLRNRHALGFICPLVEAADRLCEMVPGLNRISWVVLAVARKN
jgi:SAM-dependent methyltransferase